MPDNNNNKSIIHLHVETRLTVAPPVTGCCSPGAGAGAWAGAWAGTGVGDGEDGWHKSGCLFAAEGPSMNCYNNI